MFIHIGDNVSVLSKEIIAILDMEVATTMKDSREFLKMCEEEDFIENIMPEEMPKTIVITEQRGKSRVYLSPISAATIKKRFNMSY